ncbi:MAG: LVIVD repeat-containing protein [Candidatus Thorarchaeota archaeon]
MRVEKKIFFRKFFSFWIVLLLFLFSNISTSKAQTQFYINQIASFGGAGVGYDVSIVGDFVYITGNEGYVVGDVKNPSKPNKIGEFKIDDGAFGIFIKENLAFVAAQSQGLFITNISNPMNPTQLGHIDINGISNNVFVLNDYAYISNYDNGLHIIDISDLNNPIKIGEYSSAGRADGVAAISNVVYLANPNLGVSVLNTTLPSSPQIILTLSGSGGATGISIYENYLFVGCYSSKVMVFDISTPESPTLLGFHSDNDNGEALGVVGNNTHLFVADNFGVEFFDISNLPTITKVAEKREGVGAAHDIDFDGNFLYVAGGSSFGSLFFEINTSLKSGNLGVYIGIPIAVFVTSISIWFVYRFIIKKKKN